jgi:hypothetical protein
MVHLRLSSGSKKHEISRLGIASLSSKIIGFGTKNGPDCGSWFQYAILRFMGSNSLGTCLNARVGRLPQIGDVRAAKQEQERFRCNQYTKYPRKRTAHYIKTSALRTLALDVIKRVSGFALSNSEEFMNRVREASELRSVEEAKEKKERLAKSVERCGKLDSLIKRLYEDRVTGSLSQKRFEKLSGEYEDEQEDLENQIAELRTTPERYSEDGGRAEKFLELIRRYTDFTELMPAMLNEFEEKRRKHREYHRNYQRVWQRRRNESD